jgi:hypothetical protein
MAVPELHEIQIQAGVTGFFSFKIEGALLGKL